MQKRSRQIEESLNERALEELKATAHNYFQVFSRAPAEFLPDRGRSFSHKRQRFNVTFVWMLGMALFPIGGMQMRAATLYLPLHHSLIQKGREYGRQIGETWGPVSDRTALESIFLNLPLSFWGSGFSSGVQSYILFAVCLLALGACFPTELPLYIAKPKLFALALTAWPMSEFFRGALFGVDFSAAARLISADTLHLLIWTSGCGSKELKAYYQRGADILDFDFHMLSRIFLVFTAAVIFFGASLLNRSPVHRHAQPDLLALEP